MSQKEEKKKSFVVIVTYLVHLIAYSAIIVTLAIFIIPMCIVGGIRAFTAPKVHVVEITDKQLPVKSSRFGVYYQPTLVCNTTDGEELSVHVNGISYENVEVGDYIVVNAWRFRGDIVITELNPTLNNTVKESEE